MGRKKDERILKPDSFMNFRWNNSFVLLFAGLFTNLILLVSPMAVIRKFLWPILRSDPRYLKYTKIIIEAYVLGLLFLEGVILFYLAKPDCHWIWLGIAIFGLWDTLGATLRDIIIAPSLHEDEIGPYILVQDPIRWLIMMPVGIMQVVVCFAILLLAFGNEFHPSIIDPFNALYQSILTFSTLGYREPIHGFIAPKIIIISEVVFFYIFISMKLPIAISITRVKGRGIGNYKKKQN